MAVLLGAAACGGRPEQQTPRQQAAAAAVAYLKLQAEVLNADHDPTELRALAVAGSPTLERDEWYAVAMKRLAHPWYKLGAYEAGADVSVESADAGPDGRSAVVVAYVTRHLNRWTDDLTSALHTVRLVRAGDRWLVAGERSAPVEPKYAAALKAGGAPRAVVDRALAAARADRGGGHVPAGLRRTLAAYCAALDRHDTAAVKALFTRDSAIWQPSPTAPGDPLHRLHWKVTRISLSGTDIPGYAAGRVTFRYTSDQKSDTGYTSYELFKRGPDGRWLFFAPPLPQ